MKNVFILMGFIGATILLAQAVPVKIILPVETAVFKAAPGIELANAQCLTCHSADYVALQPPMSANFWKAEVDKMRRSSLCIRSKTAAPVCGGRFLCRLIVNFPKRK